MMRDADNSARLLGRRGDDRGKKGVEFRPSLFRSKEEVHTILDLLYSKSVLVCFVCKDELFKVQERSAVWNFLS